MRKVNSVKISKKISRGLNKTIRLGSIDERYIGHEPTWDDQATLSAKELNIQIMKAYSWYNYMLTDKDKLAVLGAYLVHDKFPKTQIQAINMADHWMIPSSIAALARMITRGFNPTTESKQRFDNAINDLLIRGKALILKKNKIMKKKANTPVLSIQDHIRNATNNHIAEIEEQIDLFSKAFKSDFRCYDYFTENQVKPVLTKRIALYYRPQLDELKQAALRKDADLVEGYRMYSKKQIVSMRDFVSGIVTDCETWGSNSKAARVPRKKQVKSVEKQTQRVKYQKEDTALKVVSINPNNIIAAQEVWIFGTKNGLMYRYVAKDLSGFQIKGTTLQNFDEKKSQCKKIRKPEEVVRSIISAGHKVAGKMFDEIKTKAYVPNGKIKDTMLILRVSSK